MKFKNTHISEKLNFINYLTYYFFFYNTDNILNFNNKSMHTNLKANNTILVILNANFLCCMFVG